MTIDYLARVSMYRENVEILLNYTRSSENSPIPLMDLKIQEINSFKFLILAHISKMLNEVIENPTYFNFDADETIAQLRQDALFQKYGWNIFERLAGYDGKIYSWISEVNEISKKIIRLSYNELHNVLTKFTEISVPVVPPVNSGELYDIFSGYCAYQGDYSKDINMLFEKRDVFKEFAMVDGNFRPVWGFYKGLILLFYHRFKIPIELDEQRNTFKILLSRQSWKRPSLAEYVKRKRLEDCLRFWPWFGLLISPGLVKLFDKKMAIE